MAVIRKYVGEGLSMVNDFTSNDVVSDILTSEANKLWRAKILLDRKTRFGSKDKPNKTLPNSLAYNSDWRPQDGEYHSDHLYYKARKQSSHTGTNEKEADVRRDINTAKENSIHWKPDIQFFNDPDWIHLIHDRDEMRKEEKQDSNSKIIIVKSNSSPIECIFLQTVPKEIDFQGESTWAVIHSMGRNTPMYHFTGAENVIQMNVSWYCTDKSNPEEVVAKCRRLEAWSKADGYQAGPPLLEIIWGDSQLFEGQYFILTSATYKLSNWRANAKVWDRKSKRFITPIGYVSPNMYPSTATQELIFRRVSSTNLTHNDIVPNDWVRKTHGLS